MWIRIYSKRRTGQNQAVAEGLDFRILLCKQSLVCIALPCYQIFHAACRHLAGAPEYVPLLEMTAFFKVSHSTCQVEGVTL